MSEPRSLGCARCGSCCENIYLAVELKILVAWRTESVESVPDPRTDEGWAYWTSEERRGGRDVNGDETFPYRDSDRDRVIERYDPEGDWRRNADFLSKHWRETSQDEDGTPRYSCDQYDPETKLCGAHEDRPPVCSGYPWYHKGVGYGVPAMNPQCSYLLDVAPDKRPANARPLIPLEVLRG